MVLRRIRAMNSQEGLRSAFNAAWNEIEQRLGDNQDPSPVRAILATAMSDLAARGVTDPRELRARGFMVVEYSFPHIIKDYVRGGT
jgi:hypothetical protein